MPSELIALLPAAPGKADQLEAALRVMIEHVEKNEPDTYRYQMHKQINKPDAPSFIMIETYKDEATMKAHTSSSAFGQLVKTIQEKGLLAGELAVYPVEAIGGFASRNQASL